MATEYQRVRDYELMVVLHPELSEEDLATEVTTIENLIVSQGGTLRLTNRESPWGRRRLSYPIRHSGRDLRDGIYVLVYFTSVSTALGEVERDIKLDDRIIRYLLTQQGAPMMEPVVEEPEGEEGATTPEGSTPDGAPATRAPGAEAPAADAPAAEAPAAAETPAVVEAAEVTAAVDDDVPAEATSEVAADETPTAATEEP